MAPSRITVVFLLALTVAAGSVKASDTDVSTGAWRENYEAKLRAPDGWLAVAGLFFLKPGPNTVGADAASDIVLPAGSAPDRVGVLRYDSHRVLFEPVTSVEASLNDQPVRGVVELRDADDALHQKADRLTLGRLTLLLHSSGHRLAVRLRDPLNPLRTGFRGLEWYPVQPAWRLSGRFIPYATPKRVPLRNVLGDVGDSTSPGEVEVELAGTVTRLLVLDDDEKLWLVFRDATSGHQTYRIRFLYFERPDAQGRVTLDFNRAENPPCAYNAFTTCPMPAAQNRLRLAIPAGERLNRASAADHGDGPSTSTGAIP